MKVEKKQLDKVQVELTIEIPQDEFKEYVEKAYRDKKGKINIPGFRKGHAPRQLIEQYYGKDFFYFDAAELCVFPKYVEAIKENEDIKPIAEPKFDVVTLEAGEPFVFTATVDTKQEITLGEYKGIELEKVDTTVTDEDLQKEIDHARENTALIEDVEDADAAVENGDIVLLDFCGKKDGVAFEGGTAENYELTIGSNSFIPGFEEGMVGMKVGEEKDLDLTFPEEYHAPDLAGKAAVFHVEVLGIKEKQLPEIDDDFAQDTTEFDTLEEYKNDIKEKLATAKEEQAKSAAENALIEQIVESSEMDIPDAMVDFQVDQMVDEFKQRLSYQGLSLEQYVQFSGQNMDALRENMKGDALKRVQGSLVLEAIVAAENIEANEEDLKKEFEKMAQMYQMEASQIEGMIPEEQKENMKKDIAVQKAVEFVLDQANVTEATEELDFEEK